MNLGDYQDDGKHIAGAPAVAGRPVDPLAPEQSDCRPPRRRSQAFQFAEAASMLYQFVWGEFCDWYIELSKGALYGDDDEASDATRAVLVFCLDRICGCCTPSCPSSPRRSGRSCRCSGPPSRS